MNYTSFDTTTTTENGFDPNPSSNQTTLGPAAGNREQACHLSHQAAVVYSWTRLAAAVPVSLLGLVANSVSAWVWQGDTVSWRPITFLFQYRAVWDNILLALSVVSIIVSHLGLTTTIRSSAEAALAAALYLAQLICVHTTLAIAVYRWLAAWKPMHVRHAVTRRRVIVTCVVPLVWCSAITAGDCVLRLQPSLAAWSELWTATRVVGLVLPLLVLVAFSVTLVWMIQRYMRSDFSHTNHGALS